jgi:hypothetical protein
MMRQADPVMFLGLRQRKAGIADTEINVLLSDWRLRWSLVTSAGLTDRHRRRSCFSLL